MGIISHWQCQGSPFTISPLRGSIANSIPFQLYSLSNILLLGRSRWYTLYSIYLIFYIFNSMVHFIHSIDYIASSLLCNSVNLCFSQVDDLMLLFVGIWVFIILCFSAVVCLPIPIPDAYSITTTFTGSFRIRSRDKLNWWSKFNHNIPFICFWSVFYFFFVILSVSLQENARDRISFILCSRFHPRMRQTPRRRRVKC